MKVFISYKFTGLKPSEFEKWVDIVKQALDYLWIQSFLCHQDYKWDVNWKILMNSVCEQIQDSDVWLVFVNHKEHSQWMLSEIGMMKSSGKTIISFVNKKFKKQHNIIHSLSDQVIYFDDVKDMEKKLLEHFALNITREQIDYVDENILEFLAMRKELVKRISKYKKRFNIPTLQPQRWQQVIDSRVKKWKKLGLSSWYIKDIWNRIHQYSLDLEDKKN